MLLFLACTVATDTAKDPAETADTAVDSGVTDTDTADSDTTPDDTDNPVDSDSGPPDDSDSTVPYDGECGDGLCDDDELASTCCDDCGVCGDPGTFTFTSGYADGGDGGGVTPGGMAAGYTSLHAGTYGSITFPMTVEIEPLADADYFWAQQFYLDGGDGGYLGLQAHGLIDGAWAGKIAIFSIWNTLGATPGPGASCETFGGEGVGYSCRIAFDWQADTTYSFTIHQVTAATWTVELYDPRSASFLELGTINVPAEWGGLEKDTVAFVEYFGDVGSCEETPYARALYHAPRGDGLTPESMEAITYGDCATAAVAECDGSVCR